MVRFSANSIGYGISLALLPVTVSAAFAQSTTEQETEARISSGEWVLNGVKVSMGQSGCEKGETYLFSRNPKTVLVKKCVSGKWQRTTLSWMLRPKPPTDTELVIDSNIYVVKFGNQHSKQTMVLRTRNGRAVAAKTTDRIFFLSED